MDILTHFEEDCISRIQASNAQKTFKMHTSVKTALPPETYFWVGISLGVLVARVACTCGLFQTPSKTARKE